MASASDVELQKLLEHVETIVERASTEPASTEAPTEAATSISAAADAGGGETRDGGDDQRKQNASRNARFDSNGGDESAESSERAAASESADPSGLALPAETALTLLHAHATRGLARYTSHALRALVDLARCTRREADAPSEIEVDPSQLPSALRLHGLDWPFMSELERAQWKGRSLQQFRRDFDENVTRIADASLDAAQAVYRTRPGVESEALRRRLRKLSTAVHLDSGSAVSLVFEAVQLFAPVLEYAAIEGRPSEAEEAEAMREREAMREALL